MMEPIELETETQKLRAKSPFRGQKMKGLFFVAVLVGVGIPCVYGNEYSKLPVDRAPVLYFAVAFILSQAFLFCIGWWLLNRSKRLIDEGVVLYAVVVSTQWLPNKIYPIKHEYEFQGQVFKKAMNGPKAEAVMLESLGRVLVVIDPVSPKRLDYLYQFASTSAERKRIYEGKSGLDAPKSQEG